MQLENTGFTNFKHRSIIKIHLRFISIFETEKLKMNQKKLEIEQEINGNNLIYKKVNKKTSNNFKKFKTKRSFRGNSGVVALNDPFEEQINLKMRLIILMSILSQKTEIEKEEKELTNKNADRLLKGSQKVPNGFECKMVSLEKQTQRGGIKILIFKRMLQRLPVALAQAEALNIYMKTY